MTAVSSEAMPRLRVLFLSPYPHGDKVTGGTEAVAQALIPAVAIQPEIEAVRIISFDRSTSRVTKQLLDDKLTVYYIPAQRRLELPTGAVLNLLRARQLAREFSPHVVHCQGIGLYGDVGTRLGFPAVVTAHGMVQVEARMREKRPIIGPARIWLVDRMIRRVLRSAQMVISTSDYDRTMLGELVRSRQISIPNPVRSEFFGYQAGPDSNRILFAGNMIPRKNVVGIVRAFALVKRQIPDARLDLVGPPGDGTYTAKVRQLVRELGVEEEVVFHGFLENSQLLDLMGRCSVLILLSNEETSPTVIAQAMAMGKPVVASRVGGIPELITEGDSGFLVDVGDEGALAERLVQLLRCPALRRSMGLQARNIAKQRSDPSVVAKQTIDVYRMVVK
jgi:glycosyltransferase involved in cell wall biosynthesis